MSTVINMGEEYLWCLSRVLMVSKEKQEKLVRKLFQNCLIVEEIQNPSTQIMNHFLSYIFGINLNAILIRPKITHFLVPMKNLPLVMFITHAETYSLFVLALKSFVHTTNTIIINKLWRRR